MMRRLPHVPVSRRLGAAKTAAVGVGGLILLGALFFGGLFKGFGLGPGSGEGDGNGKTGVTTPEGDPPKPPTDPVTPAQPTAEPVVGDVVNVLVDGEQLKLLKSPEAEVFDRANYTPVTLDRVVALAKEAEGDSGVKIRVGMRSNSDPETEERLKKALHDAGLEPTSVNWRDQTVP